jgi:hypothetical protein
VCVCVCILPNRMPFSIELTTNELLLRAAPILWLLFASGTADACAPVDVSTYASGQMLCAGTELSASGVTEVVRAGGYVDGAGGCSCTPRCECLTEQQDGVLDDAGRLLVTTQQDDTYEYPATYGIGCAAHLDGLPPFCSDPEQMWGGCITSFCFVNASACDFEHVRSTFMYNASLEVHMSYETCVYRPPSAPPPPSSPPPPPSSPPSPPCVCGWNWSSTHCFNMSGCPNVACDGWYLSWCVAAELPCRKPYANETTLVALESGWNYDDSAYDYMLNISGPDEPWFFCEDARYPPWAPPSPALPAR